MRFIELSRMLLPKPEARSPKPEARSPKPEARSSVSGKGEFLHGGREAEGAT